jgi:hypothetical protein
MPLNEGGDTLDRHSETGSEVDPRYSTLCQDLLEALS